MRRFEFFTKGSFFYIIICSESGSVKDKKIRKGKFIFNKKMIICSIILFVIIGLFCLYKFLLLPQIKLTGGKSIVVSYKEKYKEKGYKAYYLNKNITKDVKVNGSVNTDKLGEYKVTYSVKSGMFKNKVVRVVKVRDITKPKLSVNKEDVYVCPGADFVPEQVTAEDNYDGDISDKVKTVISKNKDLVTYSVTDKSGNKREINKKILYKDIEKPNIVLNGAEVVNCYLGEAYNDLGVTVTDNCDGDVQNKVKVTGGVDPNTLGEYTVNYEVSDKDNNTNSISRKVIVKERKGIVYLTFDDGPNPGTTNVILDILKEEGVKATFFVTNKGPDELIKREFDEGHTVALHTASHDYSIVYASDESYFNDLSIVQNRVKNITGVESKIVRFPGGSSNTVSRRYSSGIMSRLTAELLNRGYKYYDWNISSGDAGETTDPNVIFSNVVNNLRQNRENMVLMHDIKTYTRDALRRIIQWGKNNGYTFEKITMDTEMVTQKVNN